MAAWRIATGRHRNGAESGATMSYKEAIDKANAKRGWPAPKFTAPHTLECKGAEMITRLPDYNAKAFEEWWFRNGKDWEPIIKKELARSIFNHEGGKPPLS